MWRPILPAKRNPLTVWLLPAIALAVLPACAQIDPPAITPSTPSPGSETKLTTALDSSTSPAIAAQEQTQAQSSGFSADGNYYVQLESWRDTGAGVPNATVQILDIATNTCVAGGCIRTHHGEQDVSLSLEAAENKLLLQTQAIRQRLRLELPQAGTSLPIVGRSRHADGSEVVTVQRGNSLDPMEIRLNPHPIATASGQPTMQLEVSYGGKTRSLNILNALPPETTNVAIREVQCSANGKQGVVLLDATQRAFEGEIKHTIVQGFAL